MQRLHKSNFIHRTADTLFSIGNQERLQLKLFKKCAQQERSLIFTITVVHSPRFLLSFKFRATFELQPWIIMASSVPIDSTSITIALVESAQSRSFYRKAFFAFFGISSSIASTATIDTAALPATQFLHWLMSVRASPKHLKCCSQQSFKTWCKCGIYIECWNDRRQILLRAVHWAGTPNYAYGIDDQSSFYPG